MVLFLVGGCSAFIRGGQTRSKWSLLASKFIASWTPHSMHCRACLYSITWLYERVINQTSNLAGLIINLKHVPGLWTFQYNWGALRVNLRSLMVAGRKQAELVSFDPKSRKMLWFWLSGALWFSLTWGSKQMCICEREMGGEEHEFKWECFFVVFLTALTWKRVVQGSDRLSLYQESK